MQDVAANGIGDFDGGGGVGELADVAGGLEVVEDGFAEHAFQYRKRERIVPDAARCL